MIINFYRIYNLDVEIDIDSFLVAVHSSNSLHLGFAGGIAQSVLVVWNCHAPRDVSFVGNLTKNPSAYDLTWEFCRNDGVTRS